MYAYSALKHVLQEQQLSVSELYRRIRVRGIPVNLKSLYRLSNDQHPVERLDLRLAGAICSVVGVPLTDWIVFSEESTSLQSLPTHKQARLDFLMSKNNQGCLEQKEHEEFSALVRDVEEIMLENARRLSPQKNHHHA